MGCLGLYSSYFFLTICKTLLIELSQALLHLTASEIYIYPHIICKPNNSMIVSLFIQDISKFLTTVPNRKLSSNACFSVKRFFCCRYVSKSSWHLSSDIVGVFHAFLPFNFFCQKLAIPSSKIH